MTIMKRVRCLLSSANVPQSFWIEVVLSAIYPINITPSKDIGKKAPENVWSGHPPNLQKLRVSGCVAYAHLK